MALTVALLGFAERDFETPVVVGVVVRAPERSPVFTVSLCIDAVLLDGDVGVVATGGRSGFLCSGGFGFAVEQHGVTLTIVLLRCAEGNLETPVVVAVVVRAP